MATVTIRTLELSGKSHNNPPFSITCNTNASKNDGLQGVELQLEQKAAAEASSGCCSVL